jgi:hypothetical protein
MKRIGLLMMWGGLFGFQTGCNKQPPLGPVTIVGKAYIYGNRDPVANAVFEIIWEGRGATFLDTVHSDANGHFYKQIFPSQFPKNDFLYGIRLEHQKLPNYAYDNQIQYWYGAGIEAGVIVFERMYYPAGTKHLEFRKTTNQWDMIEIEFESMYRTAKYQLYETQPFAFDSIVGHQLRTKEIYIKKTNFQSGMVVKDTLTLSLKYKTPDTLFLNF